MLGSRRRLESANRCSQTTQLESGGGKIGQKRNQNTRWTVLLRPSHLSNNQKTPVDIDPIAALLADADPASAAKVQTPEPEPNSFRRPFLLKSTCGFHSDPHGTHEEPADPEEAENHLRWYKRLLHAAKGELMCSGGMELRQIRKHESDPFQTRKIKGVYYGNIIAKEAVIRSK